MATRPPTSPIRAALWPALGAALALGCAEGKDPPAATAVVAIPGGSFTMGIGQGDGCGLFEVSERGQLMRTEPRIESARATHAVSVEPFCIDVHEVTNEQYRHCNARGDCPLPQSTNAGDRGGDGFIAAYYAEDAGFDDYPVLGVAHEDAAAYCAFRGGFLPTEAQWEYVATSLGQRDRIWDDDGLDRLLADGCESDLDRRGSVAFGACATGVSPVSGSPADVTAQGVHDMAGNAAEWVADDFDFFAYCAGDQPGASLEERYAVEGRRPLGGVAEALVATPVDPDAPALVPGGDGLRGSGWSGACLDDFDGCADRCGDAYSVDTTDEVAQKARWQGYLCGEEQGLSDATVDALVGGAEDAPGCDEGCVAAWESCRSTAPDAPTDGGACLRSCQTEADECIVRATVPGVSTVCLQFQDGANCVPVPWCVPRADYAAEVPHIRSSALTSDPLEGTKTVRGGHYQANRACEALPTWRSYELVSSPLVGFRCAYAAGTARCPAR